MAVLLIVSTLLMQSCATSRRPVYIYDVPYVSFPTFPVPTETSFNDTTNTVTVPVEWYIQLAEYKTEIQAIEKFYKLLSEYEEAKK